MTEEDFSKLDGFSAGVLTALIATVQALPKDQRNQVHEALKRYSPRPGSPAAFADGWRSATNKFVIETR